MEEVERKRVTLHPLNPDGSVDTSVNLYPKTFIDGIVNRAGDEVDIATPIALNTAARHTHSNKQVLDGITANDITKLRNDVSANNSTIRILVDNVEIDSFTLNQDTDESINISSVTKIDSISIDDVGLPIIGKNVDIPTVRTDRNNQNLTSEQKANAKTNLDLQNVDNTSDVDKPISTATQNALNGKVPITRTINGHALSSDIIVTKGDVGLSDVDNTSDLDKPISTAQQTEFNLKENLSNKVTSLSSSSTNTQYPSAKCVYDEISYICTYEEALDVLSNDNE